LNRKVVEFKDAKEDTDKKDIKECPFNPFGDSECDMCGS
jgi:hypothetical protein